MKNIPQKIYLQIGDECPDDADFKTLEGVTWCTEREFNNDIPFVLHKTNGYTALEVLAQLLKDEYKLAEDKTITFAKAGQHYANTSSIEDVIKLLKERPPMA